jgi:pimeloyl-ACP methyl ester carboxylesterase
MRAKLARYHDDADHVFVGWNDIWLHPDFAAWSIEKEIAGIRCPIVAILGEDDEYSTPAQVAAIERNAVNAASFHDLRLADCRHSPQRDQPAIVIETIARAVEDVN